MTLQQSRYKIQENIKGTCGEHNQQIEKWPISHDYSVKTLPHERNTHTHTKKNKYGIIQVVNDTWEIYQYVYTFISIGFVQHSSLYIIYIYIYMRPISGVRWGIKVFSNIYIYIYIYIREMQRWKICIKTCLLLQRSCKISKIL